MKHLVICLLFIAAAPFLRAQQQGMVHYTVNDGLPSSNVYRVFRDSKGFVWVCTDKGIARFDGYKFEVFTIKDGLPYNDIWNIQEDSKGRLWLSTYSSYFTYYSYADKRFHSIANNIKGKKDRLTNAYQETEDGTIIALTGGDIDFLISDDKISGTLSKIRNQKSYRSIYVNPHFKREHTLYYNSENNGLQPCVFMGKSREGKLAVFPDKLNESWVIQSNQSLFFTGDLFLYKLGVFNEKITKISKQSAGLDKEDDIYYMQWISPAVFYIKTQNKTIFLDTNLNVVRNFKTELEETYNALVEDYNGHIWICTPKDGLYYSANGFQKLSESSVWLQNYRDLSENVKIVEKIIAGPDKKIWYGTSAGEVFYIENGIHKKLNLGTEMNCPVTRLYFLTENLLMINWKNGTMLLYKPGSRKLLPGVSLTKRYGNLFDSIKYIYNNSPGNMLFNYNKLARRISIRPVYRIDENNFICAVGLAIGKLTLTPEGFTIQDFFYSRHSQVYLPVLSSGKSLWLGSKKGLYYSSHSDVDSILNLQNHPPLVSKSITDMQLDSRDGLWFGTDGDGLYLFREGKAYAVKELEHEIIKSVFVDKLDQVWASTNKGAFRVSVSDYKNFKYTLTRFSLAQGLPSKEVNCVYANDTMAWICTQMGLVTIDLKARATATEVPLFYINRIITDSDTLDYTGRLVLPYNHSRVELDYVCLSFMSNRNITYLYRLEGADTVWRQTEDLKLVYPILPVGQYTLRIKALDINGRQSNEAVIEITITPPFWQTWWFRSLVLLVIACVAGILIYRRIKKIRREESEKTRINKKFAELELQALQAQMNPHFVFNSLNAIQSFVLKQDVISANDYLSKFSTLMRLFLESSRQKYISIEEELKLITLYTQMEQMRFKDKFSIAIRISHDIRRHSEIPSMLLQPFVENAINHGLVYRDGHGSLEIEFTREDTDTLVVRIEDDGIGRQAAMEIKRKSIKSYRSRAMEITEERLKTMHIIDDTDVKITIIDKTDENGNPSGTKVLIAVYYSE